MSLHLRLISGIGEKAKTGKDFPEWKQSQGYHGCKKKKTKQNHEGAQNSLGIGDSLW